MTDPPAIRTRVRIVSSGRQDLVGSEVELRRDVVWFGRAKGNEVVVADPSLSSRHARLEIKGGRFILRDNESTNGVYVEGQRVKVSDLVPGQRFRLGSTTFELLAATPAAAVEAAAEAEKDVEGTILVDRLSLLEDLGEPLVAAANQPFLITDPTSVWLVETSRVEIFTVAVDKGRPAGARSHFVTVEPGEVFFGLDSDSGGFDDGFLAAGKAGAHLRRFDLERLALCAAVPHYRPRLAAMVEGWVAACSRRLTSDLPKIPPGEVLLRPAEAAELEAEKVVTTGREVLWIELPAARLMFDGLGGLGYESEGALFPLAPGSWIELLASDTAVEVLPKTTEEVIDDPRLWAGLNLFHRLLMECELLNKRLARVDEFQRQKRKAERAEEAREVALAEIQAVLGGARAWQRPSYEGSDVGPVFAAAELVARHGAIAVRRPTSDLEGMSFEDTVLAIASESHFRVRRVALVDDWWQHEQGPLLGRLEESKKPLAILPQGRRTLAVEPASGEEWTLDDDAAAEIEPFAYSFYRAFRDGPLRAMDLVRFAAGGLRREFRDIALMGIGVGLLSTAAPAITGMVFDRAIPEAERPLLLELCLGLFLMALTLSAFKITQNVAVLRVQSKMDYGTQAAVWDRMLNLPMTFFRRYSAGDLADRADAVNEIRGIVAGTGVSAILGAFASLFNAVQMCLYSFALAAVGIVLTLIYVVTTAVLNALMLRLERTEMGQRGGLSGLVLQLISGVSKLRVSGAEDHAFRVWASDFAAMRRTAFKSGRIANVLPMLNQGFPVLSSLAIFYTMWKLQQGAAAKGETLDITTGDFLALTAAFGIFLAAMQALGNASVDILRAIPVWERLRPILEEEPEVDSSKAAPAQLRGAIEMSNVHFRYTPEGPWILRGLSLDIAPGEFVAFVGGSGCGKSTLLKVMLGFERPQKGSVYYDGQDLSTLDVRRVRQQIGVVLQESRLIPADIFRNIVGNSSRTIADAWEAAHKAGLAEDINRMPMQMHTYVSEGGGGFSGGQKQRLMIARALVHNPKILFLDEATSALDNRTQAIVTESLDRLQAARIVIAHRLSTIRGADKICYLEDGVVAEEGSYDELMEKDGLFAELARRQLA